VAEALRCQMGGSFPYIQIDLTSAYKSFAKRVVRGVAMVGDRQAVLVQDECELLRPSEVAWGMTTEASISTEEGGIARLTLSSRKLVARVLSPAGAEFSVESARQEKPQAENRGVQRLMLRLKKQSGDLRIAILLSPVWGPDSAVKRSEVKPLAEW